MTKISIIIPIYNTGKYLTKCLDSVINQTLKDLEIICVNDGSTDNSLDILKIYAKKDSRIKIIDKANSGYGKSMNMGIDNSDGEYIGIVESDDFVELNMFENLYNIAQQNNTDVVKSDFYYYENKRSRKAGKIPRNKSGKIFNIKKDTSILKMMPSIWSSLYKKDFLTKNNIRFMETPGASYQDTSFAFKTLVTAERLFFTEKAYYQYRQDNENSSVQSKAKVFCICDEWEEITNYINKKPQIKVLINDIKLSTQFNAYKWNTLRISEEYRDEFIDKYQQTFKKYCANGEIQKGFYKRVNKKELVMLLNDKTAYRKYIDILSDKQKQKQRRRKNFSIRINSSRISIILFGKQILQIG